MIDRLVRALHRLALPALLLAGCSTPLAPRYHTLMPPPAPAVVALVTPLSSAWELLPISMPAQVTRPQLAVRAADDTMALLEEERWVAPLAREFRGALAERLGRALGSGDGLRLPGQRPGQPWHVQVDVKRFDSAPGRYVLLDATWLLRPGETTASPPLICRSVFEEKVGADYATLSAGHRAALARLADVIAGALRQLDGGRPAACPVAAPG